MFRPTATMRPVLLATNGAILLVGLGIGCASSKSNRTESATTADVQREQATASTAIVHDLSPVKDLAWLAGSWISEPDDRGVITEEHWTLPRGGSMIGMNRTASTDRTLFFEFLRLEARSGGDVSYLASPRGRQPATPFRMVACAPNHTVFENLEHDFPQRVIYERDGDRLLMRIEGEQNGQMRIERWELRQISD